MRILKTTKVMAKNYEDLSRDVQNCVLVFTNEYSIYEMMLSLIRDLNRIKEDYDVFISELNIRNSRAFRLMLKHAITLAQWRSEEGCTLTTNEETDLKDYIANYIYSRLDDFK